MKKALTSIIIGILFANCSKADGDGIDCALFDPMFPSLNIKMVDGAGINLIENGTIDPTTITVEGDFPGAGFRFVPEDEFANPDADIRKFDNTLTLFIPNQPTFQYTINLNETDSFTINFTAEATRIPCDITYFEPNGAVYNGEPLNLNEVFSIQFLAVIEL